MKKLVRHLRGQPEEVRRHVLHGVILFCGCVLILLWVFSLGRTVTDENTQDRIAEEFNQLSPLETNTELPELW